LDLLRHARPHSKIGRILLVVHQIISRTPLDGSLACQLRTFLELGDFLTMSGRYYSIPSFRLVLQKSCEDGIEKKGREGDVPA
jgi:hypothetical protein